MNVSILPGVTIGDGAIIGMNAVISKSVEEYSIVVGSEQRCVGSRNQFEFKELQERKQFFGEIYPNK